MVDNYHEPIIGEEEFDLTSKFSRPEIGLCDNTPQIYLINGLKRSGKDFTANLLAKAFTASGKSVEVISFAGPMKRIIASTFGISEAQLDIYKNAPDDFLIHTDSSKDCMNISTTNFRTILQRFGTEAIKPEFGNDVWAKLAGDTIKESSADIVIISDFRFVEEYNYIYDIYGSATTTLYVQGTVTESADTHSSECKPAIIFDHIIDNSGQNDNVSNWIYQHIKGLTCK